MKTLVKRRTVTVVSLVLAGAILFYWTGVVLEKSLPPTWSPPVEIELTVKPDDTIQIGDTLFIAGVGNSGVGAEKSQDGVTWSSIDVPLAQEDKELEDVRLFKDADNHVGIVWTQRESSRNYSFFKSSYDGYAWSDPQVLFLRDKKPYLRTAMTLEDGTLLVVWNEYLVHSNWDGEVFTEARLLSYRAYIKNDVQIEPIIELEDPSQCSASGCVFDDGEYIWTISEYRCGNEEDSLYRARSVDGKAWDNYEPLRSDRIPTFVFNTGEVGTSVRHYPGCMYVYRSSDWENWSREKALDIESFRTAFVTEGTDWELWGVIYVFNDGYFFSHSVEESSAEYAQKMRSIRTVFSWPSFCVYLVGFSAALWWLIRD